MRVSYIFLIPLLIFREVYPGIRMVGWWTSHMVRRLHLYQRMRYHTFSRPQRGDSFSYRSGGGNASHKRWQILLDFPYFSFLYVAIPSRVASFYFYKKNTPLRGLNLGICQNKQIWADLLQAGQQKNDHVRVKCSCMVVLLDYVILL